MVSARHRRTGEPLPGLVRVTAEWDNVLHMLVGKEDRIRPSAHALAGKPC